ncbi:MAG: hypothetical protein JJT85_12340 [Chromatiales bacterium]|nr:hypothetical protein [Chromatiales bacterium]
MDADRQLGLFEAVGIELEYMIVDQASLDVAPVADWLLTEAAGELTDEHVADGYAWNNELALHVIEFKLDGPRPSLDGLAEGFGVQVGMAGHILASRGLMLLPTGMHPWMDPASELRLWPHDSRTIYETFDRIFSCRGHGWANLQSLHLNLPFRGDEEFRRLHTAIRLLLPVLPGLAASTPVCDGRPSGLMDTRLAVYRNNCARVPSVTGQVIPEVVDGITKYKEHILARIYRDLAPLDPDGTLAHEWVNARGAIARFDRMAIEIRVLDTQECPRMDLGFCRLIVATLQALCEESWLDTRGQQQWSEVVLARALQAAIADGEAAECHDSRYLKALGLKRGGARLDQLWAHLAEQASLRGALDADSERVIEHYLRHGTLARRISRAVGEQPGRARLESVWRELASALADNQPWAG